MLSYALGGLSQRAGLPRGETQVPPGLWWASCKGPGDGAHHFTGPKKHKFWSSQAWAPRAGCLPSLQERPREPGARARRSVSHLIHDLLASVSCKTGDTAVNVANGGVPPCVGARVP